MSQTTEQPRNILAAIDFSPITDDVVDKAALLCRLLPARLTLLHVAPREPDMFGRQLGRKLIDDANVPEDLKEAREQLNTHAQRVHAEGVEVVTVLIRGEAVGTILDEAQRSETILITMGSHGHSPLVRALVGSVSEGVLKEATCPLLLVPENADST